MQLIKIKHIRCNEYDGVVTLVFAPDDWDEAVINNAIKTAQRAYLEAYKIAAENQSGPPNPGYTFASYLASQTLSPDTTVGELQKRYDAAREEYRAWVKEEEKTRVRFETLLEKTGFISVWSTASASEYMELTVDWGHRHGSDLRYGDKELDTPFPSAAKLANKEFDEDDF